MFNFTRHCFLDDFQADIFPSDFKRFHSDPSFLPEIFGLIFVFVRLKSLLFPLDLIASDAERSRMRASLHSHMGLSNNVTHKKLLIFSIWSMELFFSFLPYNRYPWWTSPARLGRNVWRIISQSVQNIQIFNFNLMWLLVLKYSHQIWK